MPRFTIAYERAISTEFIVEAEDFDKAQDMFREAMKYPNFKQKVEDKLQNDRDIEDSWYPQSTVNEKRVVPTDLNAEMLKEYKESPCFRTGQCESNCYRCCE